MMNELAEDLGSLVALQICRIPLSVTGRWTESWVTRRRLSTEKYDLLHFFPIGSMTLGSLFRSALWRHHLEGLPVVFHAFQYPSRLAVTSSLLRVAAGRSGVVVSPSAQLIREVRRLGVKAYFMAPGVDVNRFRPATIEERRAARQAFNLDDELPVLLHVGHLRKNRNLRVLAQLPGQGFNVTMIVSPRLEADPNVREFLLRAGVRLVTGAIADIRTAYWAADCYVFPAIEAHSAVGVPLSVIEALACGTPVVSTRFDGLGEAFPSPVGGLRIAEPQEFPTAVREMVQARQDPGQIASIARSRFARRRIAGDVVSIYQEILDDSH